MDIERIARRIITGEGGAASLPLADLIEAANEAYGDDLIASYHDDPEGEHGDTLAKFIAVELRDTYEEGQTAENIVDEAVRAMGVAIRDLSSVREALLGKRRMIEHDTGMRRVLGEPEEG